MKKLLLATIFVLTNIFAFSQVANYGYTATTSTWAYNSSPTSIHAAGALGAAATALPAATNIGFNFVYNGTTYTQFKASVNGFITFNTSNTLSQPTNNLNTSTERVILAVLWDENRVGSAGTVNYKLTGTSPNRIMTIEWKALRWNKSGFSAGTIDCQIKLYETSNIIEYVYNRYTTATTWYQSFGNSAGIGASIGLGGSTSGDFLSLSDIKASPTKSTTSETTTIGSSPTNLTTLTENQANTQIPNGTTYRFYPPVANDNCSGGSSLTVNSASTCTSTTSGTTIGATQSVAACVGTADDDVWYSFVAAQTLHLLTETPGTIGDAVIQAYSGSCASLSTIACVNDATTGNETSTLTGLTIGSTYYVRVHSFANASGQGTFTMCVTSPCLGTPTSSAATSVTSNSFSANWTAVSGVTNYLLDVSTDNAFTSMVSGYNGLSVGNVTTYSVTGLSSSTNYYFRVRVSSSICTNSSTQSVVTKPINDEIASAIILTTNSTGTCTTTTVSSTVGGTQTLPAQSTYGIADDDVWFQFVATAPSLNMTVSSGTIANFVVESYTSSMVSLGVVNESFATENVSFTGLTIGSTYYIRVYSFSASNSSQGTFTMCVSTPPTISTAETLTSFGSCSGTASSEQSFTITGYGLLSDITITAPAGFELSTTSGGSFSSPITLVQSGGGVSATTIYVRMKATATGSPSGNITCSSTSATTQNIAVSGTVTPASVGGSVAADQNVLSGGNAATVNLSGHTGSVVKWQRDVVSTFATATDVANTTTSVNGASMGAITQTIYYRAVVQNGTCATANSSYVTITVVYGLPIELLYFNGVDCQTGNLISWSTASENNNDYFNIEKTKDGKDWISIMTENGAGNSTNQLYYSFVDENVESIVNYYRLKQTDYDGKFKYSDIISIDNTDNKVKKEIYSIVNALGQEVDLRYYRGLIIIEYTDGSSEKIIK